MKKLLAVCVLLAALACHKKVAPIGTNNGGGATSSSESTKVLPPPPEPQVAVANTLNDENNPAKSGPEGTKAPSSKRNAPLTKEIQGQSIYNVKCGKCHGLKVAGDYTAARWETVMVVMAPKANLSEEEREFVMAYVRANAKK